MFATTRREARSGSSAGNVGKALNDVVEAKTRGKWLTEVMRAFKLKLKCACLLLVRSEKMIDEEHSSILVRKNTTAKVLEKDVPVEGMKIIRERLMILHVGDRGMLGYVLKSRKACSLEKGEVQGIAAAGAREQVREGRIGREAC